MSEAFEPDKVERLKIVIGEGLELTGNFSKPFESGHYWINAADFDKLLALYRESQASREVPHVNKEYGTDPISDARLAEMCLETKWWKHDEDEIYRVVHELMDLREGKIRLTD